VTTAVVLAPGAPVRELLAAAPDADLAIGAGSRRSADRAHRALVAVPDAVWVDDDRADRDAVAAAHDIAAVAREASVDTLVFAPTEPGQLPLDALVAELLPEATCLVRDRRAAEPGVAGFAAAAERTPRVLARPDGKPALTLARPERGLSAPLAADLTTAADLLLARLGWAPRRVELAGAVEADADPAAAQVVIARGDDAARTATRLAARLGGTLAVDVTELARAADGAVEVAFATGGRARIEPNLDRPLVVAARPEPGAGPGFPVTDPVEHLVLIGGHGAGDTAFARLASLAERFRGIVAGSRPAVAAGRTPLKVGLTGIRVAPRALVLAGVSGAAHHRVGLGDAGCRIAIDADPTAPLLATADIALVGDAAELLAALEAELVGRFPDAS